jgi:hypothetical protein
VASDDRYAAIGRDLQKKLSQEFPLWEITQLRPGRWRAALPDWGVLYGNSAAELRDLLRRYGGGDSGDAL